MTSSVRSTPALLIDTAPLLTAKLSGLKDAAPFAEVEASSIEIAGVVELPSEEIGEVPVTPVTVPLAAPESSPASQLEDVLFHLSI